MKIGLSGYGFIIGLALGTALVAFGFWKTLFILAVGAVGYVAGYSIENGVSFWVALEEIVSKLREKF